MGWEKITDLRYGQYPICVGSKIYTIDGKLRTDDKAPSAFIDPPEWLLKFIGSKPCSFKKDELVMVKARETSDEALRYFAYYGGNKYYTYNSGNTSITSRGNASAWGYCRKAIEGQDYPDQDQE